MLTRTLLLSLVAMTMAVAPRRAQCDKLSSLVPKAYSQKLKQHRERTLDGKLSVTISRRNPANGETLYVNGVQSKDARGRFLKGLSWTNTNHYDPATGVTTFTTAKGTRQIRPGDVELEMNHLNLVSSTIKLDLEKPSARIIFEPKNAGGYSTRKIEIK